MGQASHDDEKSTGEQNEKSGTGSHARGVLEVWETKHEVEVDVTSVEEKQNMEIHGANQVAHFEAYFANSIVEQDTGNRDDGVYTNRRALGQPLTDELERTHRAR